MDKTTSEAIKMLFQSRKFWILIFDSMTSLILYFVSKYGGPYLDDVKYVILILQPVVIMVIAAIAIDNRTEAAARTAQMQLGLAAPPSREDE